MSYHDMSVGVESSVAKIQPEYDSLQQPNGEGGPQCDFYEPTLDHIEDLVEYERGGYHPVLLRDTFADGRRIADYKFYLGSSTVWLARDTQSERYVALKILSAESSDDLCDFKILESLKAKESTHKGRQYIGFLYDHFNIEGPNGSHLCLVSEVLGPSLSELTGHRRQLRGSVARKVGRQFVQAVAYLHSEGVCHGDLTAANIVFQLHNFDACSEEELYLRLGKPKTEAIQTASGQPVPESAPHYIVQSVSFTNGGSQWLQDNIRVIDFGISFFADGPPKDLGTPPSFTAPEAWFEMTAGKSTDLWALGCTLYTLRSGVTLIQLFWGGTPLEVVSEICSFLGALPERWNRLWFDEEGMPQPREGVAGDESPPQWCSKAEERTQSLHDLVMHITDEYHGPSRAVDSVEREKLPIELEIEAKGGKVMYPPEKPKQSISSAEAASFADLLGNVLRWEPAERASAEILAKHPWFRTDFPDAQTAGDAPSLFQS